jgi:hypothetical protein
LDTPLPLHNSLPQHDTAGARNIPTEGVDVEEFIAEEAELEKNVLAV